MSCLRNETKGDLQQLRQSVCLSFHPQKTLDAFSDRQITYPRYNAQAIAICNNFMYFS